VDVHNDSLFSFFFSFCVRRIGFGLMGLGFFCGVWEWEEYV
jgi:hypothetical protein